MTRAQHKPRRTAVDLHHVLSQDDLAVDARPIHVRHAAPHPPRILGVAALLLVAVLLSSSTFWAFVWWEDAARLAFFPRRGHPGPAWVAALFAWGLLTQIVTPLRLIRWLQRTSRLRIALALRAVVAWTLTALGTIAWWAFSDTPSGWLAMLAGALLLPAWVLFQLVRAAILDDG